MIRKIGTLAVMAAVVAMFAVLASAAAAEEWQAEEFPVTLKGTSTDEHTLSFGTKNPLKCKKGKVTMHATQTAANQVWTLKPAYVDGECITEGIGAKFTGFRNHGEKEGCDYLFNTAGTVDLSCEGTTQVVADVGPCTVSVPAQTGLKDFSYKEEGAGATRDYLITLTLTGIKYTITTTPGSSEFLCTAALDGKHSIGIQYSDGTYSGSLTVKGSNPANESEDIGIWVE